MQQRYDLSEYIPNEAIHSIFAAAERYYRATPWEVLRSDDRLLIDVPALGITGACATVLGASGDALGCLAFPSAEAHREFVSHIEDPPQDGRIADCGTDYLDFALIRGADLPPPVRRIITELGLPVADARAYPLPRHVSRDCTLQPLTLHDARVLAATACGLASYAKQHRQALAARIPRGAVIEGSYTTPEGFEVTVKLGGERP